MSTEQMRSEFEHYAAMKLKVDIKFISSARMGEYYDYAFDSGSLLHPLNRWWETWQASRAALVVDINPQPFYAVPCDSTPGDHYSAGVEYAKKCVSAAGITVKE
ncbi:hypothetical protein [Pectobacterium odoriferum]|uniref:hypothetical protein n=1 Tax=Pectobacterium odoriferum TaxID=78398 RepID=UPI0005047B0C|nr:hypothetical protein [Pectobacterium odoriferum]KGA31141.1 hypothetical protein KS43_19560 [Pectobacterium odoriferum]